MTGKNILVVDDEESFRKVFKLVLEKAGYKIILASSGNKALEILKKEMVDLVIVDMFMPEMSGREFSETIRKDAKLSNLKLIFVTSAKFSEEGKKAIEKLKFSDYITKPFDNNDLIARVKKVLGE